jgi:hypothetical protein
MEQSLKRKRELETWLREENKKLKQQERDDKQKQIEEKKKQDVIHERIPDK